MAQNNRNTQGNTSKRGFASMDPERQRAIASLGGKASHKNDENRSGSRGNSDNR